MTTDTRASLKRNSHVVSIGPDRAAARAMLRAVGLSDDDMDKPFVAVANLASDVTPCNVHLDRLAQKAKQGVWDANSVPFLFGTITISDGISMGTEGMKASLVSREVIADSIETVTFGESMDGLIVVAACDKNMPGAMMAMARLNVPSLFVYGGAILPGNYLGRDINIQDMFEAVGAYSQGKLTLDELYGMERVACPGEGACSGMFTANTMSSAIEAMGMSVPGAASIPAVDPRNEEIAHRAGAVLYKMLENDIKPRDIMTREAFENAITVVLAMGGSTNAVLHLLAIAHEAGVDLHIDEFDRLSRSTPYITDLRPGGRFVMSDVDKSGGLPVLMNELLRAGLLHPDVLTVTGKTLAENLAEFDTLPDSRVIYPVSEARSPTGGLVILKGNLAPEGAVMKVAGTKHLSHDGPARVFDGERAAFNAVTSGEIEGRRRGYHPLRGAQGRPWDAGNAGRYRSHHGRGTWRGHSADNGRTLFRRDTRADDRPRRAGGRRRRRDSAGRGRRPHRDGRGDARAERARAGGRAGAPPRPVDAAAAELHDGRNGQVRQAGVFRVGGSGNGVGGGRRAA